MALRFSGRLKRTSHTPAARETRICSLMPAACGSVRKRATAAPASRLALPKSSRLCRRRGLRAKVNVAVGGQPYQHRPGGHILVELLTVDLVERVIRRVVDIEVARGVLAQEKPRHARFHRRPDI